MGEKIYFEKKERKKERRNGTLARNHSPFLASFLSRLILSVLPFFSCGVQAHPFPVQEHQVLCIIFCVLYYFLLLLIVTFFFFSSFLPCFHFRPPPGYIHPSMLNVRHTKNGVQEKRASACVMVRMGDHPLVDINTLWSVFQPANSSRFELTDNHVRMILLNDLLTNSSFFFCLDLAWKVGFLHTFDAVMVVGSLIEHQT